MKEDDVAWIAEKLRGVEIDRDAYMHSSIARRRLLEDAIDLLSDEPHGTQASEWVAKAKGRLRLPIYQKITKKESRLR